jgi:hypothetical protein
MVMGDNRINDNKKFRQINDDLDSHDAGAIQHNVHPPILGQSALPMLSGLECLRKKRMVSVLIIEKS